ncbi:hypothetical protein M085_5146 [Bacteroides fragilis str. 3986 N(B)19]|nr:hypothetical protein M085_5146 [Bacteroides fragilis str. 3986 N(B)19]
MTIIPLSEVRFHPFTLQIKGYFFIPAPCFKGGDDLCHRLSSRYI